MNQPPTARATHPLLAARGVRKRYGRHAVLHGIDLDVAPGEVVALLGPNGSGKTTFMSILVGLLQADAGEVSTGRASIGWVPQGGAIYGRLTVHENLRLFAQLLRLPGDADELARQTAERAGLTRWRGHLGSELSGGLRQRLNIAVGLLGDPQLIVLDEPTTGVDLHHRHAMWQVLRERADAGRAVVYSSHSMEDAAIADRICMIVDGRVAYAGALEGLADHDQPGAFPHVSSPVARGMLALWSRAGD